jgi:hypothetical protein
MSYKTIIEPKDNGYIGILKDSQDRILFTTAVNSDIKAINNELSLYGIENLPKIPLTNISLKSITNEETVGASFKSVAVNQTIPVNLHSLAKTTQNIPRKCCGRG